MPTIDWSVFLLGALGAFAPEIVRLWELRSTPEKFAWSALYVVASVSMCVLGGVVAVLLAPDTAWKVFYAGLTAPVVISAAAKKTVARKAAPRLKGAPAGPLGQRPAAPAAARGVSAFFQAL